MFWPDWEQCLHGGQCCLMIGWFRNKGSFMVLYMRLKCSHAPNRSSQHSNPIGQFNKYQLAPWHGQVTTHSSKGSVAGMAHNRWPASKTSYVVKNDLDSWHKDNWVWLSQPAKFRGRPAAIEAIQGHTVSHTNWHTHTQTGGLGWSGFDRWELGDLSDRLTF